MKLKPGSSLLWIAVLIVAGTNVVLAQVSGSISGRIEDSSGAAIPDAMITVTSLETGAVRTATTDAVGAYRVVSLAVGRYDVKTEKAGFKTETQTGINLAVGQEAVVSLNLQVGAVTEQLTVTGEAALVNTTTSSISGLVGEREVKDLPLNGRSFDQLIALNTGSINFRGASNSATGGSARAPNANRFSVSGRRAGENYFLLNGVELAGPNQDISLPYGTSGLLLGVEAIREFNVQTDAYGAEYGKRPGAQITIVTQSGTNQLHGSLFEFLRNDKLDARNFFDGGTVPPFKRNQFGAALGGPIRRDKTFVFGNYEGFRHRLGLSSIVFVPDAQARQGLLPNAQGVYTPVVGFQPGMIPYLTNYWPSPDGGELVRTADGLPTGVARVSANPLQKINEDYGTARVDHYMSGKDSLNVSYTISDGTSVNPFANAVVAANSTLRYQVGTIQETHIFSPSVVNVFTAGISRIGYVASPGPIVPSSTFPALAIGRNPGAVAVGSGQGGGGGSLTNGGGNAVENIQGKTLFTYTEQVQIVKGNHQISTGAWFQRLRDNQPFNAMNLGTVTFSTLQNFLQGNAASFLVNPNPPHHKWRQWQGAWYVQDTVKLRPNLTVRLGLRHEFSDGWNDPQGIASYFTFDSNGVIQRDPVFGTSALAQNNAKWLFGPRAGLAWDPFGAGKTSIRAGFGIHYWVQDNNQSASGNPSPPPLTGEVNYLPQPGQSSFSFLSIAPVNPSAPVPPVCGPGVPQPCIVYSPRGLEATYKTPVIQEWNFAIEQGIGFNSTFRAAYVGSHGYHQMSTLDPNTIRPLTCSDAAGCVSGGLGTARGLVTQGTLYVPVGTRPNPFVGSTPGYHRDVTRSFYHALQLELRRRYSSGFQFRGNYTWSKSLDDGSATGNGQNLNAPGTVLNAYDPRMDYGPSSHDYRHQATISGTYELPIGKGKPWLSGVSGFADKLASGWQLNVIATLISGFPITPNTGSNNISGNGNINTTDRPNWNPAFTGPVITGNPNQWFNPNAFVLPVPGTFGNMSRGALRGPHLRNLDLSVFKDISLTERIKLQFRAEAFNILNHANFGVPSLGLFAGSARNATAGAITLTQTTSRQIQFAMKLTF